MTFKRKARIRFGHTLPIINHLNAGLARIGNQHMYFPCFGINCIFHQFFHNRCRTLNHLSGSNLIGNRIGQQMNDIAHDNV